MVNLVTAHRDAHIHSPGTCNPTTLQLSVVDGVNPKIMRQWGVILDHLSGLSVIKGPSKKERRPGRDRKCGDGSKKWKVVEDESPSQGPQPVKCKERDNVLGWPEEAALSASTLTLDPRTVRCWIWGGFGC